VILNIYKLRGKNISAKGTIPYLKMHLISLLNNQPMSRYSSSYRWKQWDKSYGR